jgi:hypothetical protein
VALSIEAASQSSPLKPATPPADNQTRSNLVLEVAYNSNLPPAYINVHGTETKPRWIWITRFNLVPGWKYPEGVSPIRAVKFEAQYNGETADVRVTVLRGSKPGQGFDQEDLVETYHIGLDDPRTVNKLKDFGVEPAKITLLNPVAVQPLWPGVDNRVKSIVTEKITLDNNSLPGYRIVFRNQADKALLALKVDVSRSDRGPISAFFQGQYGRALIEPGRVAEQFLPAITDVVANPSSPVVPTPNTIVIRSAIFADGTYEGEREPACMYEGFNQGRKVWLEAVLPLFEQQLAESTVEAPAAGAALKEKIVSLQARFHASLGANGCAPTQAQLQVVFNGQRLQLLRELDTIITTRPAPPINFRRWLQTTADRYRDWLARL